MASRIFDTIRDRVEKSEGLLPMERRAMFWFQQYGTFLSQWQQKNERRTFSTIQSDTFTKRLVPPKAAFPGYLYFFQYQPTVTTQQAYYDRLPLTLVLERTPESFLGLNFHYLPYRIRAGFFDALYSTRLVKKQDPLQTQIRVTYRILSLTTKYKAFKPCLRRYRYKNCRSGLLQVGESEWDLALFLPVERFAKATRSQVWSESTQAVFDLADEVAEE